MRCLLVFLISVLICWMMTWLLVLEVCLFLVVYLYPELFIIWIAFLLVLMMWSCSFLSGMESSVKVVMAYPMANRVL